MGSLVTFNKLSSGNRSSPTTIGALSYSLPYPREVTVKTEYGWEATEVGAIGAAIRAGIGAGREVGATGDVSAAMQSIYERTMATTKDEVKAALGSGAAQVGAAIIQNSALSGNAQVAGAMGKFGIAINPKEEVLFKGVKHRAFGMTFDLAPTTATDSVNVMAFLKELHVFAAPELTGGGAFFTYPSTCTVVIDGVLNRGNCAITSIDANLSPDSVWAVFKNNKPVHVSVTIEFLEMDLPTKDKEASLFS